MIYINDIPSLRDPESYEITPDERVEKIETIGGIVVQDLGHVAQGDVISVECVFSTENWERVKALWEARQKVTFTDSAGATWLGMRIVLRRYRPLEKFQRGYVTAQFELWRK